MKIESILSELKFADETAQMICSVPGEGIKSRIYVVGQLHENVPGAVLGDREPHLREKTVGTFIEELKTFGSEFAGNDFLMESTHEINGENYELRYFKLTHIEFEAGEVVLKSNEGELQELRESHQEPDCE